MRAWRLAGVLVLAAALPPGPARADEPVQVHIEARFVQIARDAGRELGIAWGSASPRAVASGPGFRDLPILGAAFARDGSDVLATRRTMASTGSPGRVFAGGDLAPGETRFEDVGVTLEVTPLLVDGDVRLDIQIVVDQIGAAAGMPVIETRTSQTQVVLPSGQTAVIGGLYDNRTRDAAGQLPFLGELPVLGRLFRQADFVRGVTELLVLVTPELYYEDGRPSGGPRGRPNVRNPQVDRPRIDPDRPQPQVPTYPQEQRSRGYVR